MRREGILMLLDKEKQGVAIIGALRGYNSGSDLRETTSVFGTQKSRRRGERTMKGSLTAGIAMLGMMAACGDRPDKEALVATSSQVADALSAVVEEYFDRTLELNPLFATSIGEEAEQVAELLVGDERRL
jgi:hypothetical protein